MNTNAHGWGLGQFLIAILILLLIPSGWFQGIRITSKSKIKRQGTWL